MKRFEVHFTIQCVVPFTAQDREHVANWAMRVGAEEIVRRSIPEKIHVVVTGVDEV